MTQFACSISGAKPCPKPTAWLKKLEPSFREFPRQDEAPLDVTQIGGVPVEEATTERFLGARNEFLAPVALTTADLDFGKLDKAEYDSLKKEFGGLTEVPYDESRDYEAADFLPPLVQALLNQDLEIPEPVTLPDSDEYAYPPMGEDIPIDLTGNCHGTAWEAVRAFQGQKKAAHIFLGEASIIDDKLQSKSFEPVGKSGKSMPQGLIPGDVVAFGEESDWKRMTMLLHTAVYVGGGLFFEKPNTESPSEDSPYRLATWDMLVGPVDNYVDGNFQAQAYRPSEILPPAEEVFGSDQLDQWQQDHGPLDKPVLTVIEAGLGGGIRGIWQTAMATVPLEKQPDGRYALAHSS